LGLDAFEEIYPDELPMNRTFNILLAFLVCIPRMVCADMPILGFAAGTANDQRLMERIDRILSGEAKTMLDETREAYEGMAEGDISIILIPPSE
jgi:hypothetical protein